MPSPFAFDLPTVGKIDGLIIEDFFCGFPLEAHFIDKDYYGEVHVAYRCWSDKVLTIKKGPDVGEEFANVLLGSQHRGTERAVQERAQGHRTAEVFKVKCDFRVQAKIDGDHETGKLKIVTKNVGGFTVDIFALLAGR